MRDVRNRDVAAYNAKQRAWFAANREKAAIYRKRWIERHPGVKQEWDAAYRAVNRAELTAYFEAHYLRNEAKKKAHALLWRKANPERYRELQQRRRARVRGSTVGPIDVAALWTGTCGICGDVLDAELRRPDMMSRSIDHIVPLSKGGSHTQDNLRWTHLVCNLRKGSKMPNSLSD